MQPGFFQGGKLAETNGFLRQRVMCKETHTLPLLVDKVKELFSNGVRENHKFFVEDYFFRPLPQVTFQKKRIN